MLTSIEGSRERRKSASPRIPVDLLVELCAAEDSRAEEGAREQRDAADGSDRRLDSWSDVSSAFAESYDADGLDLSATGLRLRSAVLPDVGQRLKCRFDLPEMDARCEADGEVVWSNDAGRHGEFGLRFAALSPAVESALARWVMDRGPTTLPGTEPSPEKQIEMAGSAIARVRLDGVASAIEAEVSLRDELRLDVEQALPFFELGRLATVEADGAVERRRLEHVSLRIENGVPRLVLGFVAEVSSAGGMLAPKETARATAMAPAIGAESTMQDEELDALLARADVEARAQGTPSSAGAWVTDGAVDATDTEPADDEPVEAAPVAHKKEALFAPAEDSLADEDPRLVARRRRKLDEVRRVLLDGEELPEVPPSSPGAEAAAAPLAMDALRTRARAVGAALAPSLVRLTTALRTGWAAFVSGIVPRSKQAYAAVAAWVMRVASLVGERLRERAPRLGALLTRGPAKEKRRTTAPPPAVVSHEATPRRVQRTPGSATVVLEETVSRPRVPLRYVLLAVIALGAVGSLAYAFGSGPSEPAPIELPIAPVPAAAAAEEAPARQVEPTVEAEAAAPALAPAIAEEPGPISAVSPGSVEPTAPREPTALAAASTDEGRLPMPGYPSITRSGTATSTGAGTGLAAIASSSATPSASPAVSSGRTFGAERVDHGQTTTLRMSLAPTSLEGQADAHGFTVTVRGALSLDRAAAIARSNPAVDRASILNRGDHAVLDVRFVEGRSPAYRVEIRGEQLDVTIGR